MVDAATQVEAQELLERGAGLYEAGKLYEALACWKRVLQLDPGNEIAAEYLRFIEDNFQIGVDAFMAQHQSLSAPPPPPPPPAPSRPPQAFNDEPLGDLDWSEILEDPAQGSLPPPGSPPVDVVDLGEPDEDFFSELGPGSLTPTPGAEAQAWQPASEPEGAPEAPRAPPPLDADPLAMDASTFSAPVAPAAPRVDPPRADTLVNMAAVVTGEDGRDLEQMSDDSIEVMLEHDFKAWEEDDLVDDGASAAFDVGVQQGTAPVGALGGVDVDGSGDASAQADASDIFGRPFVDATPPPLPAPAPDDSLEISAQALSPPAEALGSPALRGEVRSRPRTPAPAMLSAPPVAPDEVPFEVPTADALAPADSVEIPLDGMLAAAETEGLAGRGQARTGPTYADGDGEDPFAALEAAFSGFAGETSASGRSFDELADAVVAAPAWAGGDDALEPLEVTRRAQPPALPPEALGAAAGAEGSPIDFDFMPEPAAPALDAVDFSIPAETPPAVADEEALGLDFLPPAGHAILGHGLGDDEGSDDEVSLPDVDFAEVEASVGPGGMLAQHDDGPEFMLDDDEIDFGFDEPAPARHAPSAPPFALDDDEDDEGFDFVSPVPGDLEADAFAFDDHAPTAAGLGAAPPVERPIATPAPAAPAAQAIPRRASVEPARGPGASEGIEALLRAGLADIEAIESGTGETRSEDVRQLIKAPPADADFDAMMAEARRRQQAGDFSGSTELVEQVLAGEPDHAEAQRYLAENTTRLLAMYRSRLGRLSKVPKLKLRPQEIIWQSLDHRAGFVLAQVDGMTCYEDIIEIAGMSEIEATRILARLVEHGVIG